MDEEEAKMYNAVRQWVIENPSSIGVITLAITTGLRDYANEARKERGEWEVIACMAMEKRLFNGNQKFLADKIESMKSTNCIRWDHTVEVLRKQHRYQMEKHGAWERQEAALGEKKDE
jgi:hypothetical protein